jgi:5'-nucleotidase
MIVYVDMDGVLCDYFNAYRVHRKLYPHIEFPQISEDFWVHSIYAIKGAVKAVNILRKVHDVYILSAPSIKNPASYSGKRKWIENYFDYELSKKLILSSYKGLLLGDILIDDNIKGKGQEDFKGRLIHYGQEEFPTWKEVLAELL